MNLESLATTVQTVLEQISSVTSLASLEALRSALLGKKGHLSLLMQQLSQLAPSERPAFGQKIHERKQELEAAFQKKQVQLEEQLLLDQIQKETLDPTGPASVPYRGSLHLLSQVIERVIQIFQSLGFELGLGPEVETEFFNFEAMNIPADHPARDMQDTFFLSPGILLRTHTSPVQIRSMLAQQWPLRLIVPGTVYRRDDLDATHTPMFHQIEGFWVDESIRMSHLKGVLEYFVQKLFGSRTQVRFRPSYFPFVEPGVEVDVSCFQCGSHPKEGCRICKGTGWLEILGGGMIHSHLFEVVGYAKTPSVTGFAFGMGVERLAMLLSQLPDIRILYQGDLRFLRQY